MSVLIGQIPRNFSIKSDFTVGTWGRDGYEFNCHEYIWTRKLYLVTQESPHPGPSYFLIVTGIFLYEEYWNPRLITIIDIKPPSTNIISIWALLCWPVNIRVVIYESPSWWPAYKIPEAGIVPTPRLREFNHLQESSYKLLGIGDNYAPATVTLRSVWELWSFY